MTGHGVTATPVVLVPLLGAAVAGSAGVKIAVTGAEGLNAGRAAVHVAWPDDSAAALQSVTPPRVKATVPASVEVGLDVTVAVAVNGWYGCAVAVLSVTVVVVATGTASA